MADEYGRKWDRCLADTAVKTGQYLNLSFCYYTTVFRGSLRKLKNVGYTDKSFVKAYLTGLSDYHHAGPV